MRDVYAFIFCFILRIYVYNVFIFTLDFWIAIRDRLARIQYSPEQIIPGVCQHRLISRDAIKYIRQIPHTAVLIRSWIANCVTFRHCYLLCGLQKCAAKRALTVRSRENA
ncbi:hypothetical protein PUN28_006842 [Cardiocondyla obscurior]|uniref:Secreted protein n=1 Tax=Cardiocondyla obscurior TaxID=286306 RepID=A0AAW2G3F0_9HYME